MEDLNQFGKQNAHKKGNPTWHSMPTTWTFPLEPIDHLDMVWFNFLVSNLS